MKKTFDELRMCRVDGRKPTARERWVAFHRLWRIANGQDHYQDFAAADCFRVLFPNWGPIRLLEEGESSPSRVAAPPFLRKMLLAADKRRRLGFPDMAEMQRLASKVRESGIEVTPDQCAEVRQKVLRLARAKGLEMGIPLPADDHELLQLLRRKD